MSGRTRIVIADDHAVLRESLAALLATQADFLVAGKAANGKEALAEVERCRPDVLVLDLFMPESDGFEVLRTLDRTNSRVASVVLTASDNKLDHVQVVQLAARGLVLKADGSEALFAAIRAVAKGGLAFAKQIEQQVLAAIAGEARPLADPLLRLSTREREVAVLVAGGLKNRDIAQQLAISENTVKRHLQSIFAKTGAHDRLELIDMSSGEKRHAA